MMLQRTGLREHVRMIRAAAEGKKIRVEVGFWVRGISAERRTGSTIILRCPARPGLEGGFRERPWGDAPSAKMPAGPSFEASLTRSTSG